MLILESIKLAYQSIIGSKLRSFLTLLGIAIGLFSIIIVMTAISAIQQNIVDAFNEIGANNFFVQKYPAFQAGGPHARRQYRNRKDLTPYEGEKLREMTELPAAVGIVLNATGRVVRFRNEKTNPTVYVAGTNVDYFVALDLEMEDGRMYTNADVELSRPVAVLGHDVVDKLFKNISPVGQTIRVDKFEFEVIGTFAKRGTVLGQSQDNFVCIPLPVFQKYFGRERSASFLIMAPSKDLIQETMDEVIGALRLIRGVAPGEDNDFEIVTNDQLTEQFNELTKYFRLGAAVIAFIALIAAGVGIMNIMLVSVTERTKEIGIRKAVGAQKKNILTQFVIEAVALSWFGGLIGIALGLIGGNIVALYLSVSLILPIDWIVIGLIITTVVGVVFGVYPAMKAANLDPIEALRYE
ncbi:ABC transporter permease [Melioribacter sp. Ez-97]|uniref:ABC transporter permease n=1 Tax=Melioribacter sp. Ez-97 TaxID=3423434 RepID=UPI003EDA5237